MVSPTSSWGLVCSGGGTSLPRKRLDAISAAMLSATPADSLAWSGARLAPDIMTAATALCTAITSGWAPASLVVHRSGNTRDSAFSCSG